MAMYAGVEEEITASGEIPWSYDLHRVICRDTVGLEYAPSLVTQGKAGSKKIINRILNPYL